MNAQTSVEREPCPVCFNDDVSSLERLIGCGHTICRDCKYNLKKTSNQNVSQLLYAGRHHCTIVSVKCPICRAIEKPSYQLLETKISMLKKHIKDIEAKLLEKQVIEIQLREQLRNQTRNPPSIPRTEVHTTIPRAEVINLVGPESQVNPSAQRPVRRNQRPCNPTPLMFCQSAGCTRRNRTRDRCRNHPEVPCCKKHYRVCDQCRPPSREP